jgi:hypothetical protein
MSSKQVKAKKVKISVVGYPGSGKSYLVEK